MTDAETGQRGDTLTNDKTYLASYEKAVGDLSALPSQLYRSVADSSVQLSRVDKLNKALEEKLDELASTISAQDC